MKADYPLAPFLDAPRGILASLIIFGAAACLGQIIFTLIHSGFWDPHDMTGVGFYLREALFSTPFTFVIGLLSGIGIIFLIIDFACLYRLIHDEGSRLDLFFTIAACQMGMMISVWLVHSREYPGEYIPWSVLACILLAFSYWIAKLIRKKIEQVQSTNAASRRGC